MENNTSSLDNYFYCKDHDIYYPNTKQCCPACQMKIVESYLDRLIEVRDHYHKVGEGWEQPSFRVTQDMADQPGGTGHVTSLGADKTTADKDDHRTDIFKDQEPIDKEEQK